MKTIIRINNEDGTHAFVYRNFPTIKTIEDERLALRMDFQQALATSLALATLNIGHCMITRSDWPPVETNHLKLTED